MSRHPCRSLLCALALLASGPAAPAQDLLTEVLPVGYRDARELLEVLRPLVPAPGSISAFNDRLIVRTTADNMASIRGLLLELDRAPANLLISVRHTLDEEIRRDLLAARARAGGAGTGISIRGGTRLSTARGDEVQRLRVLEGHEAFIQDGESIPVGERTVVIGGARIVARDSVRYEDFTSGFLVRARLNGDRVTLDILRHRAQASGERADLAPSAQVTEVGTSVSGELGRWIELAGTGSVASSTSGTLGAARARDTRREQGVFVKVERLAR